MNKMYSNIYGALFGVVVGDALGVPVEFESRKYLAMNPVTDMIGYGTYHQPPGTWSDDSSLTLCLADSLLKGYDPASIANSFIAWSYEGCWTPYGRVFDIGITTSYAIHRLASGVNPLLAGGDEEDENGNGSLMRILPLLFYVKDMPVEKRYKYVSEVSSLTHRHIRSILACFIYIEYALQLLKGNDKYKAFEQMRINVNEFINKNSFTDYETDKFHRLLLRPVGNYKIKPIYEYSECEIASSGYVVHSLEAAIWCLLKEDSFEATVLRAVNLGEDTDTTGAIAGGLAGLLYGFESIPQRWIKQLARKDDIEMLCKEFFLTFGETK